MDAASAAAVSGAALAGGVAESASGCAPQAHAARMTGSTGSACLANRNRRRISYPSIPPAAWNITDASPAGGVVAR